MAPVSNSVIRNLQITFSISVILLLVSLFSSFFSIERLVQNIARVNHTNEILIEAENIISYVKDGETGQRGFLITRNQSFLEPYTNSRTKAEYSLVRVKELTADNPAQQRRCELIDRLIKEKSDKMETIIHLVASKKNLTEDDIRAEYSELTIGKQIMDNLRETVKMVKDTEKSLLAERMGNQEKFIEYARLLVIIASVISILITLFSYFRIKKDMDERIAKQEDEQRQYAETANRISEMQKVTAAIADNDFSARSSDLGDDQLGRIGHSLNDMAENLEKNFDQITSQVWLQEGVAFVSESLRGRKSVVEISNSLMESLITYTDASVGTIYVRNDQGVFGLTASYAVKNAPQEQKPGEGLVGQVIVSQELMKVSDLPARYLNIESSTGGTEAVTLMIFPLLHDEQTIAAIELGFLTQPNAEVEELIRRKLTGMAIGVVGAIEHERAQNLLEETMAQAEELQAQHTELESLNTELEAQAQSLQASEEELKVQQEELQQINTELEERSSLLEEKNQEIQNKAEELALSTRYKSEFLANMSHELRTPLNSILLLSRLLSDNSDKNLSEDQIEYARVIQNSGNGLLWLIDEILDISKIEAGKMELDYEMIDLRNVVSDLKSMFLPLAKEKGLDLILTINKSVPEQVETDRMRLEQILKNLLSNAMKFTAEGSVSITVQRCKGRENYLCIHVKDTGIGIPKEKQQLIFQAFQQADGSTKRKFGGTGLGLSISRELIKLLGGDIELISEEGKGSEFTVTLPIAKSTNSAISFTKQEPDAIAEPEPEIDDRKTFRSPLIPQNIPDDRNSIKPGDNIILIVEDDVNFAKALLEFTHEKGYKGVVAVRGDEGVVLAEELQPAGILLDIELPVKSGWEVMDDLKNSPKTRHIPVHMMSSHKMKKEGMRKGAIDFIEKPMAFEQMKVVFEKIENVLTKFPKKVLIIEDNKKHAEALSYFLEVNEINAEVRENVSEGLAALRDPETDAVILDMGIPASNAYEVLEQVKKNDGMEDLPIIIFTGKSLSMAEEMKIKQYADSIIIKTAHSYQRMLEEVSIFLHLMEERKKDAGKLQEKRLGAMQDVLREKTVLIADDDIRNIFSLSKALEPLKMKVITATDGKAALDKLEEHPEVDIVLLDMMMPEMDGYETARRIRSSSKFKHLPVIAVTAKAMTGDREKCITAGASDYITKPVDIDQLLSLLRVWLYDSK